MERLKMLSMEDVLALPDVDNPRQCEWCGDTLTGEQESYCSWNCRNRRWPKKYMSYKNIYWPGFFPRKHRYRKPIYYCPAFTEELKEHIRNRYNRTCTTCEKSALQNVNKNGEWLGRLSIDHVDENKMQGCGDWEWRLTPLCHNCHGKMRNQQKHLLLRLLVLNNPLEQINFEEVTE